MKNKEKSFSRRAILKAVAGVGLAAVLGSGIVGICSRAPEEPAYHGKRAVNSKIQALYESRFNPMGIAVHKDEVFPSSEGDYLTYAVAVPKQDTLKNIEDAFNGEKNDAELRFELRRLRLNNHKEDVLCALPFNREQFAGGEQHRVTTNSDVSSSSDLRYERVLENTNGKRTYGLLETVVSEPSSPRMIYSDGRNFEELLGFAPIGAGNRVWVAGFYQGENNKYIVGSSRQNKVLTRKDIIEVGVPLIPDNNSFYAKLEDELRKNVSDKNDADEAIKVIRKYSETSQREWKARTELKLPAGYKISCFSGNAVYGFNYNPKSRSYSIWKGELNKVGDKK